MPFIKEVKKHALENYEASFGWSEVIECYEDKELEELTAGAKTAGEAIAKVGKIVDIRDERFRDAVGPEIECLDCGTKFGENTICPNWAKHERPVGP